ncbi:MAG: PhnD/SsuA/transferrin family substrate-binding protein, partial [Acidimicrobiia bacterium]
ETEPPATTEPLPEKLIFGFVPSERVETLGDAVQPYMDYLTQELGIPFEGVVTADYTGLVVAMGTGGAQFGAFGPVGYVQAAALYDNIGPLMQSARFGSFTYHGQWMTNDPAICTEPPIEGALVNVDGVPTLLPADDPLVLAQQVGWAPEGDVPNATQEVLDDGTEVSKGLACQAPISSVSGRKVAFGSPTSTSATLYPTLQLIEAGIDLENDIEASNLSPSHVAAIEAVYNGDFDFGTGFDDSRRNLRKPAEGGFADVGAKVIVFNLTPEIPNDVVAVDLNLPAQIIQAVYDATEKFLATEEGFAVFQEIYEWTEIRPAVDSDFDVVRRLVAQLGVEGD